MPGELIKRFLNFSTVTLKRVFGEIVELGMGRIKIVGKICQEILLVLSFVLIGAVLGVWAYGGIFGKDIGDLRERTEQLDTALTDSLRNEHGLKLTIADLRKELAGAHRSASDALARSQRLETESRTDAQAAGLLTGEIGSARRSAEDLGGILDQIGIILEGIQELNRGKDSGSGE